MIKRLLSSLAILALWSLSAPAYDLVLDLDDDGDPGTLRIHTPEDRAMVKLVLEPTQQGEWISSLTFGLGGTCWECWGNEVPYVYGVDCDLYWQIQGWLADNPLFAQSWADISLCWGCCGGAGPGDGFHYIFSAVAAGDGFALDGPIFLTEFEAWVNDGHVFDQCPHPPSNLITFPFPFGGPDAEGNEIQIGDEFVPVEPGNWSLVKSLY